MSLGVPRPDAKSPLSGSTFLCRGSVDELKLPPPPLRSYLCFTIFTCFCPAYPVNLVALVFSILSRKSYDIGDYDGSRQLGRTALYVAIASFIIGLLVIVVFCTVHFTQLHL